MTDTALLREHINKSGYKLSYVAERCGLTVQGLLNKINNKSDFRANEIQAICSLLNIDCNEKEKIFFCS